MILRNLINKVKYLFRDKEFESDINTGNVECSILYNNAFDEYDNNEIAYRLSSIYMQYMFINDDNLSTEYNHFCCILNMYGFRYITFELDGKTVLILEGSLADYDELIAMYYDEDIVASEDPFISATMSQLIYVPYDYFNNVKYPEEWGEKYLSYNFYAGSCYKSIVRSNVKPDLVCMIEHDYITLDFDNLDEIEDLKYDLQCIYLSVLCDDDRYDMPEIDTLISFADSHCIVKTRSGDHVAIVKIRPLPLVQYMNIYPDSDISMSIGEIEELDIELDKEEKDNDEYYKDIDEIIEI